MAASTGESSTRPVACRTGRCGNSIEPRQHFGANHTDERDVQSVGQATIDVAVKRDSVAETILWGSGLTPGCDSAGSQIEYIIL
jgi:hypothetical protein